MIYGYDIASQFRPVDDLIKDAAAWAKHNNNNKEALAIAMVPFEGQLVSYVRSRLETGAVFSIPADVAALARTGVQNISTVGHDAFVDSCFARCLCRSTLVKGTVVFSVIDAEPNRRKVHRNNLLEKTTSLVVVRVHSPKLLDGPDVESASTVDGIG